MGYDDEFRIAYTMVPALTTMALPLREMGAAAMTGCSANCQRAPRKPDDETRPPALETLVPCRLVVRESTGPVPAGRA